MIHKGYEITNEGWMFVAVPPDYDGPEDGRIIIGNSIKECIESIDEQEEEIADGATFRREMEAFSGGFAENH